MKLFYFEDYKNIYPDMTGRELTDLLIYDSLREYGIKKAEIKRTAKGKPYIDDDIHISVSHSKNSFVCLISDVNIGIDIQHLKKANIDKLSSRYFTAEEVRYVREKGEEGFFTIWTRKEAYSKFTGRGLEEILVKTSIFGIENVEFVDFKLEDELYCSCCYAKQVV